MKKVGGPVFVLLLLALVAVGGAAALAIVGVNVVQRSVGAHTVEGRSLADPDAGSTQPARSQAPGDRLPDASVPTLSAADRQVWADAKITQWLAGYGRESVTELAEPYRHVEAWFAPAEGELRLLVNASKVSGDELEDIGSAVMRRLAPRDASLDTVTVSTSDGSLSETTGR